MKIEEVFARRRFIMLDGAMGTQLQLRGLTTEQKPELAAFIMPDVLTAVHRDYARAGADILLANTFGANPRKLKGTGYTVQQVIEASIACARTAAQETGALVALDIGPIGELLAPAGTLPFEDACAQFAEMVRAGAAAGAALVFLETMTDLYELKAAILAAKENCDLPVFTSMSFEARGRTFTGCTVESYGITAAGLGADAVGINCSLGPKEILPFAQRLCRVVPAGMPVFVKPNAGLPNLDGSYDITPAEFAAEMAAYLPTGISMLGGCCGSEPESIRLLKELTQDKTPAAKTPIVRSRLCTPVRCVEVNGITVVGERINPTGKKRLQQALREGDSAYACAQAVAQAEAGAELLDVNAGLPDIDEPATLEMLVRELQSITDLPLQLDSSNKEAYARALRIYNGKPLINSVNGKKESMEKIFPLAKKYGGVVVCLTLDESGIPESAEGRIKIAEKIINTAKEYGINKKDLIIDTLAMTVSTGAENAKRTLQALSYVRNTLGVNTVLGVSNISFGLPKRDNINAAFFTLAMGSGLSAGIINPKSDSMMNAFYSYCALNGYDENFETYISKTSDSAPTAKNDKTDLKTAVINGLSGAAGENARELLKTEQPLDIINLYLIPALDVVGKGFEDGTIFLPQLLMSADAAKAAFDEIKASIPAEANGSEKKNKIVIATVKGDIHDIGKNIVKVLLENYGFDVIDLGKDVDPEIIVDTAIKEKVKLVGLSALMTTTVVNMEETIRLLRKRYPECKVMVGGAVMTQDYADRIGADSYAKDAMGAVRYAERLFSDEQ